MYKLIILLFAIQLSASANLEIIDTYGKQYSFSGVIEEFPSQKLGILCDANSNETTKTILLDEPLSNLPTPVVPGSIMIDNTGIRRMMVLFSSDQQQGLASPGCKVSILGSIWYADWLSEQNPLLLIVDEIMPIE